MIVANNAVANTSTFNFSYNINIPANIDYANMAKASYGVYYNNNAEEGTTQNVVLASPVGIKTAEKAELSVNITAQNKFTGESIPANGNVKEGDYITYNIAVTNTSNEPAENAKASIEFPQGFARLVVQDTGMSDWPLQYNKEYSSPYVVDLGTINANETKNISIDIVAGNIIYEDEVERTLRTTVTADKMDGEAVGVFTSNLEKGYVTGLLTATYENKNVDLDTNIEYTIRIENVDDETKSNVVARLILPEGLEYISSGTANGEYEGNYNQSSRELTFNIGTLEGNNNVYLTINAKVTNEANGALQTRASLICDGMENEFYTNTVTIYYGTPKVEATLSSNVSQGNLLDTDTIEYYIDVKNTGDIPVRVNISNTTPAELLNSSYSIEVSNGERTDKDNFTSNYVSEIVDLAVGGSARLTIKAKPVAIGNGSTKEVTVTPKVEVLKQYTDEVLQEVSVNSLTHTIQGTGGSNSTGVPGSYRIAGTAWLDSNKDGKKGTDEQKLSI